MLNSRPIPTRPLNAASGTSAKLPVSSSEPAITTRIRPSENTAPANSVGSVPHVSSGIPEVTVIASRPPNAMYAPARKLATSALSHDSFAFVAPVLMPAWVISFGSLNDIYGLPSSCRAIRATASSSVAELCPAATHA